MEAVHSSTRRHGLSDWERRSGELPASILRCLPGALTAAVALLVSVLVLALLSPEFRQVPASGPPFVAGSIHDALRIFAENLLVLALYAMGNVAVAVIRRWRTDERQPMTRGRDISSRLALAAVIGLLLCAACRQAYVLGHGLAGFAGYFYVSRWRIWLGVLPHALPELTGILLPVAALVFATRRGRQRDLLALTVAAVLVALPLLAGAALTEVYVAPSAFRALTCIKETEGFRAGGATCAPEPRECPRLSPAEFEKRFHIHLSPAELAATRRHCGRSASPVTPRR
jgi:hypothetical protein